MAKRINLKVFIVFLLLSVWPAMANNTKTFSENSSRVTVQDEKKAKWVLTEIENLDDGLPHDKIVLGQNSVTIHDNRRATTAPYAPLVSYTWSVRWSEPPIVLVEGSEFRITAEVHKPTGYEDKPLDWFGVFSHYMELLPGPYAFFNIDKTNETDSSDTYVLTVESVPAINPEQWITYQLQISPRLYADTKARIRRQYIYRPIVSDNEDDKLDIELNLADGQKFIQGDDLPISVVATKGDTPQKGVIISAEIINPNGVRFSPQTWNWAITDATGRADLNFYLPTCAAVGDWRVEVEATYNKDTASITRTIDLRELVVTNDQIRSNIKKIIDLWKSSPDIPNGMDQPFISSLWTIKVPIGIVVNKWNFWGYEQFAPYACSDYTRKTLRFLNGIRYSKEKSTRLLMAGVEYGAIRDVTGHLHVAVALLPYGKSGINQAQGGYVLEPWFNQKKEAWTMEKWVGLFVSIPAGVAAIGATLSSGGLLGVPILLGGKLILEVWLGNPYQYQYPITGSPDTGHYPILLDTIPDELKDWFIIIPGDTDYVDYEKRPPKTSILTHSPVEMLITDDLGRQVGRPFGPGFVSDIPFSDQVFVVKEDGDFAHVIILPEGRYQVHIKGVDDGVFNLVAAKDGSIVNYGEQPIQAETQATLILDSNDLNQALSLPNGNIVQPKSGFSEEDKPLPAPEDQPAAGDDDSGCFIATAVFGSPMEKYVMVLSAFRDRFLLNSKAGRVFVKNYYLYSPSIADFLREHDLFRMTTKYALLPLVGYAYLTLQKPVLGILLPIFIISGMMLLFMLKRRKSRMFYKVSN